MIHEHLCFHVSIKYMANVVNNTTIAIGMQFDDLLVSTDKGCLLPMQQKLPQLQTEF